MKEMISHRQDADGKFYVRCNSSSLDIINSCMRKAYYALEKGYRSEETSEATSFGSAIHNSLERFYSCKPGERNSEFIDGLLSDFGKGFALLGELDDKRSLGNGRKILQEYFKIYAGDQWEAFADESGIYCERNFKFKLFESESLEVEWFGRIDSVMRNSHSGELAVFDHKTSSSLGKEFLMRWDPNHQIVGYVMGARSLGLDVNKAIINGIQVAKTKSDMMRVELNIQDYHIEQFTDAVLWNVRQYLLGLTHDLWPMAGGYTCSGLGSCQYINVCSAHPQSREIMLKGINRKNETKELRHSKGTYETLNPINLTE